MTGAPWPSSSLWPCIKHSTLEIFQHSWAQKDHLPQLTGSASSNEVQEAVNLYRKNSIPVDGQLGIHQDFRVLLWRATSHSPSWCLELFLLQDRVVIFLLLNFMRILSSSFYTPSGILKTERLIAMKTLPNFLPSTSDCWHKYRY